MQLKTILNRVQKFKRFTFGKVTWRENTSEPALQVSVHPRRNSWAECSMCRRDCSGYDTQPERHYEFVPMWGIKVYLAYSPRRVSCPDCGERVEYVPWSTGKSRLTKAYAWHLSSWAKRMSWKEVAEVFHTTWHHVFVSVEMAVKWGLKNRDISGVKAIGVDEIQWRDGHKYLTLVYQIDSNNKRLLWIGKERKEKTLQRFFDWFGKDRAARLRYVCSDMWKPYLNVIRANAGEAIHILDRFHIMANINKAIDKVRAGEARKMKTDGYDPVLKNSRWVLLKRPENLTDKQSIKLRDLLQYNLRSVRSYLLKEEFQQLWNYTSPYWAGRFLDSWCTKTMRSKIDPMKKIARQMRKHRPLIMNWFEAKGQFSSGIVEGFNNKAKLTMRRSYGFKTFKSIEIALYHAIGDLPEPHNTHRFF